MNQRNVEAISHLIQYWRPSDAGETLAEYLASCGCLGPASKVLTGNEGQPDLCSAIYAQWLERIAKGEA